VICFSSWVGFGGCDPNPHIQRVIRQGSLKEDVPSCQFRLVSPFKGISPKSNNHFHDLSFNGALDLFITQHPLS